MLDQPLAAVGKRSVHAVPDRKWRRVYFARIGAVSAGHASCKRASLGAADCADIDLINALPPVRQPACKL